MVGGFGIAGHLSFVLGFGYPLSPAYPALVQAHGHAQLVGWVGMVVMGTSLYFVPRLASVPVRHPRWIAAIPWLMGTGLLLRVLGQAVVPSLDPFAPLRWVVAAGSLLEAGGILAYLALLLGTLPGTGGIASQPAFGAVRPYFGMMVAGWLVYAAVTLVLSVELGRRGGAVLSPAWNDVAVRAFIDLTVLPVALAHSVRVLPMFLALSAAFWPVRAGAYAYLAGVGLLLVPEALAVLGIEATFLGRLGGLGLVVRGAVLLWFTWQLDLLTRRRPVERPARFLFTGPDRAPTRPGLPDCGEFGRFERLVYSAYVWLVCAAGCEVVNGAATLLGRPAVIAPTVVRHMLLTGFISLLIFGVAVRMLPGFLKRRAVASPVLVEATFWLGNLAAAGRVAPAFLPATGAMPLIDTAARAAFGLSGPLGLIAVACLTVNLWRTARSPESSSR
jgi:uncharacterized protein involved in response to NO